MMGALGDAGVTFDIEGYRQRLSRRPMAKAYAEGNLRILANSDDLTPDLAAQAMTVWYEVEADDDPVSDSTANDVRDVVLQSLGVSNQVAQELAQEVAEKKSTYDAVSGFTGIKGEDLGGGGFFSQVIHGAGAWVGNTAGAVAGAVTDIPKRILKGGIDGLLKNPDGSLDLVTIGILAAAAYFVFGRRRTA